MSRHGNLAQTRPRSCQCDCGRLVVTGNVGIYCLVAAYLGFIAAIRTCAGTCQAKCKSVRAPARAIGWVVKVIGVWQLGSRIWQRPRIVHHAHIDPCLCHKLILRRAPFYPLPHLQ